MHDESESSSWVRWDIASLVLLSVALCFMAQNAVFGAVTLFVAGTLVPVAVVAAIVYGKGDQRLLAIGASVPAVVMLSQAVVIFVYATFQGWDDLDDFEGATVLVPLQFALVPACGGLAVLARWVYGSYPAIDDSEELPLRRFQFSIRSMIVATTLAAVACTAWLVLPVMPSSILFLGVMFAIVVLTTIFLYLSCHSESKRAKRWRTFGVGASVPIFVMGTIVVTAMVISMFDWSVFAQRDFNFGLKIGLPLLAVLAFAGGRLALWVKGHLSG